MLSLALSRDEQNQAGLPPLPQAIEETGGVGVPEKGFRLSTAQLQKLKSVAAATRAAYDSAYIAASLEWEQMVREGK